jgi:hypothetical protein
LTTKKKQKRREPVPKDFVVIRADFKEEWSGNYGPMKTYALELEEAPQGSGVSHQVEINQKPTTAPPTPGETLSGDITPNRNPDFAPRFKKAQKEGFSGGSSGGGGGTFKPRDPSEIAGARHAHNLLVAAHSFEPLQPAAADGRMDGKLIQQRLEDLEAFACDLDGKTAAISDAAKGAATGETVVQKEASKAPSDIPF